MCQLFLYVVILCKWVLPVILLRFLHFSCGPSENILLLLINMISIEFSLIWTCLHKIQILLPQIKTGKYIFYVQNINFSRIFLDLSLNLIFILHSSLSIRSKLSIPFSLIPILPFFFFFFFFFQENTIPTFFEAAFLLSFLQMCCKC